MKMKKESNIMKITKELLEEHLGTLNKSQLILIRKDIDSLINSVKSTKKNDGAEATLITNNDSFLSTDVLAYGKDTLEIVSLKSTKKNQGYGKELLNEICEKYKDKVIVLKAEPLFSSEKEYNTCTDFEERIDKLQKYYESNGFASINDLVGYECAVAMIYTKDLSGEIYAQINKDLVEFENAKKSKMHG
jgi:hypothetical protein